MIFLALRHLTARRRQTLMTFLGIFFAAASFVTISGFFLGFQEFIVDQLVNNDAQIRISAKEEYIEVSQMEPLFFPNLKHVFWISPPGGRRDNDSILNPQGWYRTLETSPLVEAFSPQLSIQILATRANTTISSRLIGSEVLRQQYVTNIQSYMVEGKFTDIAFGGNQVIAGIELLKRLGARVSETLLLSIGVGAPIPFKVVGSFETGLRNIDNGTLFAALSDVQKLNGTPMRVNDIAVRVKDVSKARDIAQTWSHLGSEMVQSWDEINANVLNVFTVQNVIRFSASFVIVLVASFGVYNILNMVVNQKKREIAILRSMGYERSDVVLLFLLQGVILGLLGGAIGVFTGYWICRGIQLIPFNVGGRMGMGGGLKMSFSTHIYYYGFAIAFFSSIVASFLPARAAGRMQPIEIIRSGAE